MVRVIFDPSYVDDYLFATDRAFDKKYLSKDLFNTIKNIAQKSKEDFTYIIGGDHSITERYIKKFKPDSLVWIDHHPDIGFDYLIPQYGYGLSNIIGSTSCSIVLAIPKIFWPDVDKCLDLWKLRRLQMVNVINISEIEIVYNLLGKRVYVSIDCDAFWPYFVASTHALQTFHDYYNSDKMLDLPNPSKILKFVWKLRKDKKIVAIDYVEHRDYLDKKGLSKRFAELILYNEDKDFGSFFEQNRITLEELESILNLGSPIPR